MPKAESAKLTVPKFRGLEYAKSFVSGGIGGMALVFVGHPFDLIKVRLQTSSNYTGFSNAIYRILKEEGIRGLYKGMATPLAGVTPIFAIYFWAYDVGLKYSRQYVSKSSSNTFGDIIIAGGFSAVPATLVMTPVERIKVLMQTQVKTKVYSSGWNAARSLVREGGVSSLYKGTVATLLRDIPGTMAYFGAYEVVKDYLAKINSDKGKALGSGAVLVAGSAAGIANWVVALPADVIKSRLQTAPKGTYTGTFHCLSLLLKNEGPKALFKGLGPVLLRAVPANAACFYGVEMARNFLNKLF